ncbi:MAG: hypothetical protein D6753_04860 [Planctomycetota bacterium]|nr:MAG: hypothetical protein D6753_04860 [Planctomycetota bacterium]
MQENDADFVDDLLSVVTSEASVGEGLSAEEAGNSSDDSDLIGAAHDDQAPDPVDHLSRLVTEAVAVTGADAEALDIQDTGAQNGSSSESLTQVTDTLPDAERTLGDQSSEDSPAGEEAPTESPAEAQKWWPRVKGRIARWSRTYGIAAGVTASLAGGAFLTGKWSATRGALRSDPEIAGATDAPDYAMFVAAVGRRGEPIQPVLPFLELKPEVVQLGARLFHDRGLSASGRVACATCHNPAAGGTDGLRFSVGDSGQPLTRNTPSVLNVGLSSIFTWDGRASSLERLLDEPLLDPDQMGADWNRVEIYMQSIPSYVAAFRKHLGGDPSPTRIRQALAAYLRSLTTLDSRFDRWLQGEESAISTEELDGYRMFRRFGCIDCHNGPSVGGNLLRQVGVAETLENSPYASLWEDSGRAGVTSRDRDLHVFRVPSLRTSARSAPYFHDGSVPSLHEAIRVMCKYQCGVEPNSEEVRRIGLFLSALDGELPVVSRVPPSVSRSFAARQDP